jgi:hypothetical protein
MSSHNSSPRRLRKHRGERVAPALDQRLTPEKAQALPGSRSPAPKAPELFPGAFFFSDERRLQMRPRARHAQGSTPPHRHRPESAMK